MFCIWLIDVLSDTVDERTPAPVEVGSLSHYLQYIPGGAGFLPPTCRFEVIVRPSRCSLSAGSVDPKPVRFTRGGHDVQSDTMIKHQVLPIHPCRGRYDTEGRIYNLFLLAGKRMQGDCPLNRKQLFVSPFGWRRICVTRRVARFTGVASMSICFLSESCCCRAHVTATSTV